MFSWYEILESLTNNKSNFCVKVLIFYEQHLMRHFYLHYYNVLILNADLNFNISSESVRLKKIRQSLKQQKNLKNIIDFVTLYPLKYLSKQVIMKKATVLSFKNI